MIALERTVAERRRRVLDRSGRRRSRRAVAVVALVTGLGVAAAGVDVAGAGLLGDVLPPLPAEITSTLAPAEPFLEPPTGLPTLPANPAGALIDGLRSLSLEMGVAKDPTAAVLKAALSPEILGNLALTVNDLLSCARISKKHYGAIPADVLKEAAKEHGNGGGLNPADYQDVRQCAVRLWRSAGYLEKALTKAVLAPGPDINLWPVLYVTRSATNNLYNHDYALIVDTAGNDTYNNNAGGNLIDVNWGPAGQPGVKGVAPAARGCQQAIPGLTRADCVPLVSLLLDTAGHDTYGVKQAPDPDFDGNGIPDGPDVVGDKECTADPIIRRMMTNGAGFLGVGILVDRAGNDRYIAKTVANGAGHIFGVGILHDKAGHDHYTEVRNSTGFALVGSVGVLRDYAGDDRHDFYLPAPIDPTAPNQTLAGPGGVIDDEDVCDNQPRYDVGGGNVGATGVFVDDAGNDTYAGGFTASFGAPFGASGGGGGSQGHGNNGGVGVLVDRAGTDTYTAWAFLRAADTDPWSLTQIPGFRADATTLLPTVDPATQQGGVTGTGGVFQDV